MMGYDIKLIFTWKSTVEHVAQWTTKGFPYGRSAVRIWVMNNRTTDSSSSELDHWWTLGGHRGKRGLPDLVKANNVCLRCSGLISQPGCPSKDAQSGRLGRWNDESRSELSRLRTERRRCDTSLRVLGNRDLRFCQIFSQIWARLNFFLFYKNLNILRK